MGMISCDFPKFKPQKSRARSVLVALIYPHGREPVENVENSRALSLYSLDVLPQHGGFLVQRQFWVQKFCEFCYGKTSGTRILLYTWWLIPLSKWVITPVIKGIIRVNPLITEVITHLLSGMSHQVTSWYFHDSSMIFPWYFIHCIYLFAPVWVSKKNNFRSPELGGETWRDSRWTARAFCSAACLTFHQDSKLENVETLGIYQCLPGLPFSYQSNLGFFPLPLVGKTGAINSGLSLEPASACLMSSWFGTPAQRWATCRPHWAAETGQVFYGFFHNAQLLSAARPAISAPGSCCGQNAPRQLGEFPSRLNQKSHMDGFGDWPAGLGVHFVHEVVLHVVNDRPANPLGEAPKKEREAANFKHCLLENALPICAPFVDTHKCFIFTKWGPQDS